MEKITEQSSKYNHLETMSVSELLKNINNEDKTVPLAIEKSLPAIEAVVNLVFEKMTQGGRLFYIGAGTSGRLGIVDASECPPTFGVPHDWVIGIIAGGDTAIRKAVEFAEDDTHQAWKDLQKYHINTKDVVIGIAASGSTPYVLGGIETAKQNNIATACIVCNTPSPLSKIAQYPIEIIVGPEFITGSTRMKAGTAQKLVLNMISTSVMIKLGRVLDNKMIDMQLSNKKLVDRATKMLANTIGIQEQEAALLIQKHGNVRKAMEMFKK